MNPHGFEKEGYIYACCINLPSISISILLLSMGYANWENIQKILVWLMGESLGGGIPAQMLHRDKFHDLEDLLAFKHISKAISF